VPVPRIARLSKRRELVVAVRKWKYRFPNVVVFVNRKSARRKVIFHGCAAASCFHLSKFALIDATKTSNGG
jgi:hypothetical protein